MAKSKRQKAGKSGQPKPAAEPFRLAAVLASDSPFALRWSGPFILAVVAFTALFLLLLGPYVQTNFGHDLGVYYSIAWKMHWGLRPSVDFYCPFGFLIFVPVWAGIELTGANASCISTSTVLVYVLVSGLAWAVCRRRFGSLLSCVFVLFVGLVAIRANHLRLPASGTSYAGLYNRQGYAMLGILMAQAFLPLRVKSRRTEWLDGAVFGVLLAVLYYWKVTFFMSALGLLAVGLCLRHFGVRWLCGCLAGGLTVLLGIAIYFRGNLLAYIQDLRLSAAAHDAAVTMTLLPESLVMASLTAILLSAFFALSRTPGNFGSWYAPRELMHFFLPIGLTAGVSICIILTNSPEGPRWDAPLFCFLALALLQSAADRIREAGLPTSRMASLIGIAALVLFVPVQSGVASLLYCADWKTDKAPAAAGNGSHFNSEPLTKLFVLDFGGNPPMPVTFCDEINDGVKLLNGAVFPNATVECLDFSNWFPFAMGSRPAPSSCAWQTRFLQNEKVHPSFDRAFGRADFLLIPRFPADPLTYQMMQSVYEKEIEATYERVAQSECWALLKKRWQKN